MNRRPNFLPLLFLIFFILPAAAHQFQGRHDLIDFADSTKGEHGRKKLRGDVAIPADKRPICITDTFRNYTIVLRPDSGFVALDRQGKFMYQVYLFDNGPDYPVEGLFRIVKNKKIGFANAKTGKIVIPPQYGCAYPFENGKAQVGITCETISEPGGEHHVWASKNWFYIDKKGQRISPVSKPKTGKTIQRQPLPHHANSKLRQNH